MTRRELPRIPTPAISRRAWVAHLSGQGATAAEIARALGVSQAKVERYVEEDLCRRLHSGLVTP